MALQQDFSFNGVLISNAYYKVTSAEVTKEQIIANISIYTNKDTADNQEGALQILTCIVPHDVSDAAENVIKQIYEYLKTTDEFADAVNV